jgi:hypothetical protein
MSWRISGKERDHDFTSVSLLLHGNGTNGSTTITDSSPTPKTVTAVGNAQISTAQSKFGGGSIAFDGTGDYLSLPESNGFTFGTGDFTIELFFRASSIRTQALYHSGLVAGPILYLTNDVKAAWFFSGTNRVISGPGSYAINTWHHAALTRSGSSTRLFIDGSQVGSVFVDSSNYTSSMPRVGASYDSALPFDGYIDEFRITKGIARYTANFTPPTAPFPDI